MWDKSLKNRDDKAENVFQSLYNIFSFFEKIDIILLNNSMQFLNKY